MGRIKLIYFLIIMSFSINASSQVKKVTPVLLPFEKSFLDILTRDSINDLEITLPYTTFSMGLTKSEFNGLFILKHKTNIKLQTLGNGKLYQLSKANNAYELLRLDSTIHSGVNFNSFTFTLKDTIFQYGGAGFWRMRGIVTFFSKKTKQWELLQANKIVLGYDSDTDLKLFKANKAENKIYLSSSNYYTDFPTSLNIELIDSCYQFDFTKREWSTLGKLNPILKTRLSNATNLNYSSGNYLAFSADLENYWVNYSNNTFGKFTAAKNNEIKQEWTNFYPVAEVEKYFTFMLGDSLNFLKVNEDNTLDRRVISLTEKDFDLASTDYIYSNKVNILEKLSSLLKENWIALLITCILILISIYILRAERRRKKLPEAVNTILYNNFYASISEVDKELLQVLFQHYLNGEELTTKTINKIIGVQQKDILTQNKSRSDHFIKINQKFSLSTQQKAALILKKRDEQDKRQFTYALNLTFITEIERLLKN